MKLSLIDKCGIVNLSELLSNNDETTSPFSSLTTLYHVSFD